MPAHLIGVGRKPRFRSPAAPAAADHGRRRWDCLHAPPQAIIANPHKPTPPGVSRPYLGYSETRGNTGLQLKEGIGVQNTPRDVKPVGDLDGISKAAIDEHFDVLYKGYVNKLNEIDAKLGQVNMAAANPTYSELRELKKEQVFAMDAVRLHEWYFENLGATGGPSGDIQTLIEHDYGSMSRWEQEFKSAAMAARGWVCLSWDRSEHRLVIVMTDIHSEAAWNCTPLLVMDVYEHAYMIDFGTARKSYVEAFFRNINWDVVNARVSHYQIMSERRAA